MRVALIADIHGNLVALEAVLAAIDREQPDQVVCLGDVAEDGPQPHEVIAQFKKRGYPCVLGNTDERMFNPPVYDVSSTRARQAVEEEAWSIAQLSQDDLAYLRALPFRVEVSLGEGTSLLCFHGSPRANTDVIVATTPLDQLDPMFEGYHATVLAGAHTHTPLLRRYHEMTFVNPGSVGLPLERIPPLGAVYRPPWAEYGLVSWTNGELRVDLRRVPIDVGAVVQAALKSDMPHAESWANMWLERSKS